MKRSPMKPRTKSLRTFTPLTAKTAMTRTAFRRKGGLPVAGGKVAKGSKLAGIKPKPKKDPMPPEMRQYVYLRAEGLCDACARPLSEPWEAHHRRLRSHGGPHHAANLLALCPPCHARAHSRRKAWGEPRGYIVTRTPTSDFNTRPVLRHGRDWVHPTADGWIPAEAPDDYIPGTNGQAA